LITEIEVKNFKTLRDVRIPLAPGITVMVGANNSGKSNALAVLKLVAEIQKQRSMDAAIEALGGLESVRTRGQSDVPRFSLQAHFEGRAVECSTGLDRKEELNFWTFRQSSSRRVRNPPIAPHRVLREAPPPASWQKLFKEFLTATRVLDLSVAALRVPALVRQGAQLGPDGRDIAAVLDNLGGEDPSLRDAIDETVRMAAREVKRVVTRPAAEPGTKVLGIEERDGRVYGAEDVSDGLLLFVGLAVAAQLKANRPGILAIEEPERGIHPRRIRELLDHLLRVTQSGTQVVLTTHSPTLLDEFRDTPESVLIFDRDEKGTHVTRLSDRQDWADELKKGMPLGDLWYSGVLGGVPGR
jgi:predicted ATPase